MAPLALQMPLRMSDEYFGVVKAALGDMGCVWSAWGYFLSFQGCFGSVIRCIWTLRVIWECFLLNSHQFTWCTYKSNDVFQKTWRSQMSQISKCPNVTVVLTYWEASRDVSELSYKSLLYSTSVGSYCRGVSKGTECDRLTALQSNTILTNQQLCWKLYTKL